ncbi:helix-turn-helix transcriptional regulator [Corynebacterium lizhenjunii]|uniref:Helix-turn-helix transcriptional regulator n=1 Tax=Corynebacterium lizhenjunii TaxID=2709394 RepID=A0A7T0KFH2_9CORY|nr:helix-turn-helix transcriptional regulator [Corynebacterium lizhenjunii]QPK79104.1 helix-turn-helix transcriptional regulator [Corynebacterium lizhenjunii]
MDPLSVLQHSPLSLSEVSRRSGVSRNTLHLWLRGESQPSLATMDKIMLVLGHQLNVQAQRLSDADAATAARILANDLRPELATAAVEAWMQRFADWGDAAHPRTLLSRAAWASHPYGRPGALHFLPTNPVTVASSADASGQTWAFSGAFAQGNLQQAEAPEAKPHIPIPDTAHSTIIWCEDPATAAPSLPSHVRQTPQPVRGGTSLVPIGAHECAHASKQGALRFVSPTQLAIDILAEAHQPSLGGADA